MVLEARLQPLQKGGVHFPPTGILHIDRQSPADRALSQPFLDALAQQHVGRCASSKPRSAALVPLDGALSHARLHARGRGRAASWSRQCRSRTSCRPSSAARAPGRRRSHPSRRRRERLRPSPRPAKAQRASGASLPKRSRRARRRRRGETRVVKKPGRSGRARCSFLRFYV